MKLNRRVVLMIAVMMVLVERGHAAEFEKLGSALGNALGTKSVSKKTFKNDKGETIDAFYSKGSSGSPARIAFVEKGLYNPGNCTHTWVIALNGTTQAVEDVRVVEMSCTHAHPTKAASYTAQYKGKKPADMKTLKDKIKTIAKATGSSDLMTEAVQRALSNAVQVRPQLN